MREWTIDEVRRAAAGAIGVPAVEIGDDTDLLEHGMDSIRMMRFAGALRADGYDVPLRRLAESPSVAAWHAILGAEAGRG